MDTRLYSMMCYVLPPVSSIVMLFEAKGERELRFHAWQSLYLLIAYIVILLSIELLAAAAGLVLRQLGLIFDFIQSLFLCSTLILWAICLITSYRGKKIVLPLVGGLALRRVEKNERQ